MNLLAPWGLLQNVQSISTHLNFCQHLLDVVELDHLVTHRTNKNLHKRFKVKMLSQTYFKINLLTVPCKSTTSKLVMNQPVWGKVFWLGTIQQTFLGGKRTSHISIKLEILYKLIAKLSPFYANFTPSSRFWNQLVQAKIELRY